MAADTSSNSRLILLSFLVLMAICSPVLCSHGQKKGKHLLLKIEDFKEFKKLLRTKTNLLLIFTKTEKSLSSIQSVVQTVAEEMKGKSTIVTINCSDAKKLCKKFKAPSSEIHIKHFKDGEFNRDYDRKYTVKSMVKFLQDPKGDIPWEEDPDAENVVHIDSEQNLNKMLKKQKLPMLLMFYAPWCGFCKRFKPEFAAAAKELKGKAILAGIDVDQPQFLQLRISYNITGFPTTYYFENGKVLYQYGGENTQAGIIKWMADPGPPKEQEQESAWSDIESDVEHLTEDTFDEFLQTHSSVLVMFYAPWCGHCKKMKPEFTDAAAALQTQNIDGYLAAVDATKEVKLGERFKVSGYPTVKYFKDGEFLWDYNERKKEQIISFMKDPKEPPPPPPPEPNWEEVESDVVHLTTDTFKTFLRKKKHTLVMFYAPWCGHCKKAKPEFQTAASQFKEDTKVAYCAIDCTKHTPVCNANDVKGYPTLKYFNYGKNPQDYMGGRSADDFTKFMSSLAGIPKTSSSPQEALFEKLLGYVNKDIHYLSSSVFDSFIQEYRSALVMFYNANNLDKNLAKEFSIAASRLKEERIPGVLAVVDGVADVALASRFDIVSFATIKYFRNGSPMIDCVAKNAHEMVVFMKDPPESVAQINWASGLSRVIHPNSDQFVELLQTHAKVFTAFYTENCVGCEEMKSEFMFAANAMKNDNTLVFAALNCASYHDLCTSHKVKSYPSLKLFEHGKFSKDFNKKPVRANFINFIHGKQRDEL